MKGITILFPMAHFLLPARI